MEETIHRSAWKVRFFVGLIMLFLALFGMIFTDIKFEGAWLYWRIVTPLYALLSIALSLYLKNKKSRSQTISIWKEILHWTGLLLAVYLVYIHVHGGFISGFQAGVEVMVLLSLATFLAGIYIDPSFLVVGTTLGLIVAGVNFLGQYLYVLLFPVIGIAILALYWITSRKKMPA